MPKDNYSGNESDRAKKIEEQIFSIPEKHTNSKASKKQHGKRDNK